MNSVYRKFVRYGNAAKPLRALLASALRVLFSAANGLITVYTVIKIIPPNYHGGIYSLLVSLPKSVLFSDMATIVQQSALYK